MANSKAIWCITYSDYTTEFVKAYNVWQITNTGKISKDNDMIVSISRIDFVGGWYYEEDIKDVSEWN